MNLRNALNVAILGAGLAGVVTSGCGREHIEAVNLANEGDRSIKVNVEGAIQKYEQARQLDPTNHAILWKLAKAYRKKEDWEKMASVLAQATTQAPEFANYHFERGYAHIKMAEAGNLEMYEEAKAPFQECIKQDPNFAECYHFLGQAMEWTDDTQGALENYTKAVQHDPTTSYFYPAPAALYVTYKLYDQAEAILKEGTRMIPATEETKNNLFELHMLLFQVAQAKGDQAGMLSAVENAEKVAGESNAEIVSFNLGSTYAVMEPPQKEKAVRMLNTFSKRACRSAQATKFKEQCATAQSLLQDLGGGS